MDILAALCAILVAAIIAYFGGRRSKGRDQKLDAAKQEAKRHGRIDEADLGIGASDGANVDWMQRFTDRHRKR